MIKEFLYDGSFEGLLTTIFYAYSEKGEVKISKKHLHVPSLLSETKEITKEEDKASRVYESIQNKLSSDTLENVYCLYLSDLPDVETLIYQYIKLCFAFGDSINLAKHHDIIQKVDKYTRRVTYEAHRFTGFVRFTEVSPMIFYAKIEPDHHILPLIASHFTERFSDQHFIIHDLKREVAAVYNQKELIIKPLSIQEGKRILEFSTSDTYENIFRSFYTSVTIEERINKRLQHQYLPRRYHKHLTELSP
jgi:probable DNA metabolism protein